MNYIIERASSVIKRLRADKINNIGASHRQLKLCRVANAFPRTSYHYSSSTAGRTPERSGHDVSDTYMSCFELLRVQSKPRPRRVPGLFVAQQSEPYAPWSSRSV